MKIVIVNKDDEVIGSKERALLKRDDIYRVSALWVTNSQGEILLARRALDKMHDPGKWGPAVSGSVEEGESYRSSLKKKAAAEIGLSGADFKRLRGFRRSHKYNYFCEWYMVVVDRKAEDFKLQSDEVEEVKWFKREKLAADLEKHPAKYLSALGLYLEMFV